MSNENLENKPRLKYVLIKGMLLFIIINFLFAFINPLPNIGKFSAYNLFFSGRVRLPFGEKSNEAYNLSLYNLEAMFASHELAVNKKPSDEFRVLLLGDSSVWGYLLKPGNTLSAYLNAAHIKISGNRTVHAYNLGYPTMSLAKDLLILSYSMRYDPDLIIWLVTLESFPVDKQLDSPILQNNPHVVQDLINFHSINLNPSDPRFITPNVWESTLIGQRRALADIMRLQLFGIMWAATGIDQYYPESYTPPQENLEADETFHGYKPPELNPGDLSFDILSAGSALAEKIPIIYINEPIYLSHGDNSDIRYNFFYPLWAYDQYRQLFDQNCRKNNWHCLDEWDLVPPDEFTNSAIHMTPLGTYQLAREIEPAIRSIQTP